MPREIRFEPIPKTSTGKIQKFQLRERAKSAPRDRVTDDAACPDPTSPWCCATRDARGVVTLTLNRPQAFNALSEAMLEALQAALDALARRRRRCARSCSPPPARPSAPATT